MFDETDLFRRGVALQEKKDYDRAIEAFTEAIRLNPLIRRHVADDLAEARRGATQ